MKHTQVYLLIALINYNQIYTSEKTQNVTKKDIIASIKKDQNIIREYHDQNNAVHIISIAATTAITALSIATNAPTKEIAISAVMSGALLNLGLGVSWMATQSQHPQEAQSSNNLEKIALEIGISQEQINKINEQCYDDEDKHESKRTKMFRDEIVRSLYDPNSKIN